MKRTAQENEGPSVWSCRAVTMTRLSILGDLSRVERGSYSGKAAKCNFVIMRSLGRVIRAASMFVSERCPEWPTCVEALVLVPYLRRSISDVPTYDMIEPNQNAKQDHGRGSRGGDAKAL